MQFVLTVIYHLFCLMYKRDGTLQMFNKKSRMTWKFILKFGPSFKQEITFIHSIWKKLRFAFRQRKFFNEDSEFLLNKQF